MNRRSFCASMIALPATLSAASRLGQRPTDNQARALVWNSAHVIRILLSDSLDHPFYWWPTTLLSYQVEFEQTIDLDHLKLTRVETGEILPIQFSEVVRDAGGLRRARLHFFSDLASGAQREFILTVADAPMAHAPQVAERREGGTIMLDSGTVKVRIPESQTVSGDAPGPLLQLARGEGWIGSSVFAIEGDRVIRITTTRVDTGPLFIAYRIVYETAAGSRYVAHVQCIAGMDFVRLQEDMEAMLSGARGMITTTWTGFEPTHRQSPNHPFPLPDQIMPYDDYTWEDIDSPWVKPDVRFGASLPIYPSILPEAQLPIFIGIYEPAPGNTTIGPWANYWDRHTGDALGVFIDDAAGWQDHEYAYEVESSSLQVRAYYRDKKLSWQWPLIRGSRSTCLTCYDHAKDRQAMQEQERCTKPLLREGLSYQVPLSFTSHTLFLENRYGTLDLNRVKDWVLEYPTDARRAPVIFNGGAVKTASELEQKVMASPLVCTLPVTGTRQMDGHGPIPGRSIVNFSPVPTRQIQGTWIDGFNRLNASMTDGQRKRLTAMYLFLAYVLAGEDFMPQVPMLSGHPNYFADVKSVAPSMSFLFPDHPMALTWAAMWQKLVELNTRFNTRPSVKSWNADGGRWTEDIGTYVWAFVRPSLRTDFLLKKYDGQARFITSQLAEMVEWLVNSLSAPFAGETPEGFKTLMAVDHGREWGVVAPGKGPRRLYPAIGAHAEQRIPPRSLWYLGNSLLRFAPLAAEHAMWASRPTDQDAETAPGSEPPWDDIMYAVPDNFGTNPHLRSRKHTGYGITLRAAVGMPDELSVHLQQIDQGPNYRWGWAGEGGCGLIYLYAAGKSWSLNGAEDVGDRRDQDTDFCTNFGVFRAGEFRSIGENVLSRPFYSLGTGQFAEIVSRETLPHQLANEYLSRSILLAGSEYFVVYDAVADQSLVHRLSWFVRRGSELPSIQFAKGANGADRETQRTDHQTDATIGVWFDGVGDSMAIVSHRKDVKVESTAFGCRIFVASATDLIFRSQIPVNFSDGATFFDGTAGMIRRTTERTEFALFHGTRIGVSGLVLSTQDKDFGIGGVVAPGEPPRGSYYAPNATSLRITAGALGEKTVFYIDGAARTARREGDSLLLDLDSGQHQWELTGGLPMPVAPHILRTENHAGGARVVIAPVASATAYRLEISHNNGATWTAGSAGKPQPEIDLDGLTNGQKIHVRAIASNAARSSEAGPEYPLYVSNRPPPTPEGLHVELAAGLATITWGEVLGATEYRLYLRARGQKPFQLIYKGIECIYLDKRPSVQPSNAIPGRASDPAPPGIVEYMVAAVNGNGESPLSPVSDTDPASWRNWNPKPGEPFRRIYSYPENSPQLPGEPARYYPG